MGMTSSITGGISGKVCGFSERTSVFTQEVRKVINPRERIAVVLFMAYRFWFWKIMVLV